MSKRIDLPSGQAVTRYFSHGRMLYQFDGTDATLEGRDIRELARIERSERAEAQPPTTARWASPVCANCQHPDPHWIAAGQDICTARNCNCECWRAAP